MSRGVVAWTSFARLQESGYNEGAGIRGRENPTTKPSSHHLKHYYVRRRRPSISCQMAKKGLTYRLFYCWGEFVGSYPLVFLIIPLLLPLPMLPFFWPPPLNADIITLFGPVITRTPGNFLHPRFAQTIYLPLSFQWSGPSTTSSTAKLAITIPRSWKTSVAETRICLPLSRRTSNALNVGKRRKFAHSSPQALRRRGDELQSPTKGGQLLTYVIRKEGLLSTDLVHKIHDFEDEFRHNATFIHNGKGSLAVSGVGLKRKQRSCQVKYCGTQTSVQPDVRPGRARIPGCRPSRKLSSIGTLKTANTSLLTTPSRM